MAGQFLGAFFAALLLWGNYADMIALVEKEIGSENKYSMATAGIFASYPSHKEVSTLVLSSRKHWLQVK